MDSRVFIKNAQALIKEIKDNQLAASTLGSTYADQKPRLQKEVSQLFAGLQNPSLPSAYQLRDAAQSAGYVVDPRVLYRIGQFDNV